jgi:hypothetical protein
VVRSVDVLQVVWRILRDEAPPGAPPAP